MPLPRAALTQGWVASQDCSDKAQQRDTKKTKTVKSKKAKSNVTHDRGDASDINNDVDAIETKNTKQKHVKKRDASDSKGDIVDIVSDAGSQECDSTPLGTATGDVSADATMSRYSGQRSHPYHNGAPGGAVGAAHHGGGQRNAPPAPPGVHLAGFSPNMTGLSGAAPILGFATHSVDGASQPGRHQAGVITGLMGRGVDGRRGKVVHVAADYLKSVAQQAIEKVSSAGHHVTLQRLQEEIEETLAVPLIWVAGVHGGRVDAIPVVHELMRVQCKVNAYIQAFVKVRSVATVHELSESLREYVNEKRDFSELNLGPLVKQPLVYEFFKMPADAAILPLDTFDVYELLRGYLSEKKLWTSRNLAMDELMTYMAEKQGVASPYELGLRIQSPALLIGVLKKAQRDCGQTMRSTMERLDIQFQGQLVSIFGQFSAGLVTTEGGACAVRQRLLALDPARLLDRVFEGYITLLRCLGRVAERDLSCGGGEGKGRPKVKENLCRAAEMFCMQLRTDGLAQQLFKFSVCVAREDMHVQLAELVQRGAGAAEAVERAEGAQRKKAAPSHDAVRRLVRTYLDRCLAHGPLRLKQLQLVEEKVIAELGLEHFHETGQGRSLLAFILLDPEIQQFLEECGGSGFTAGTASNAADLSAYHPTSHDLLEFVRQCQIADSSQYMLIEGALCRHYGVNAVRSLGHGSVTHLSEKQVKGGRQPTIFYEAALCAKKSSPTNRSVGILGPQTRQSALRCLQCCPLLVDLANWSHWRLVFAPELGDLKQFLLKYGGVCRLEKAAVGHVTSLLALETSPDHFLRLCAQSTPESFAAAAADADVATTCGHLVSVVALNGGVHLAPIALLSNHMKTALFTQHASDSHDEGEVTSRAEERAAHFLIGCLVLLPLVICESVADQVFVEPFGQVAGRAKSKRLLLDACRTDADRSRLQHLGLLLGVSTWSESCQLRSETPLYEDAAPSFEEGGEVTTTTTAAAPSGGSEATDADVNVVDDSDAGISGRSYESAADCEMTESTDDDSSDDDVKIIDDSDVIILESDDESDDESGDESDDEADDEETARSDDDVKVETIGDDVGAGCSAQHAVVEEIRREEFGVLVQLSVAGERLMEKQRERLGRSLRRLAADLYSRDTHFVLELVQNADDNAYPDASDLPTDTSVPRVPAIRFIVEKDCVTVLNNEKGFEEKNIRAICDVGRSTKGQHTYGYIGQKGIGFKSVFRVTDAPEIHSNGFHIRFDVLSGPMGYILPHWVDDSPGGTHSGDDGWTTRIVLPLKESLYSETQCLAGRFHDVHPSLLLFLHRLKSLHIENRVENMVTSIERRDLANGVIEITHNARAERWLVVRKTVDTRQMSLQAKSGVQVDSTEIALAFPLPSKKRLKSRIAPEKQPVFAFLPLRSYGFRFIIQGDFDVPSSREDVDQDSAWNQWLRAAIHQLFVSAIDAFKCHYDVVEATVAFLAFVPAEDEISDFFRPVVSALLGQLKARASLPAQPLPGGDIVWRLPSQLVITHDKVVRDVISPSLLRQHLAVDYLHADVAAALSPALADSLGVQKLTTSHFIDIGATVTAQFGAVKSAEELTTAVVSLARWLVCIYRSLDEFADNTEHLDKLRALPIMPLQDGRLVSLSTKTVFFLVADSSESKRCEAEHRALYVDLCTVHPATLTSLDGVANSQVRHLLEQLGVKQLAPHDIIEHHILPTLDAADWKDTAPELLLACVLYVKRQWDGGAACVGGATATRLRACVVVLTSAGPRRPAETAVHFSPAYDNPVDLRTQLAGYDWTLLSDDYIKSGSGSQSRSWRNFFLPFGVVDFLAVVSRSVTLSAEQLETSTWAAYKALLPTCDVYKVADFQCDEFIALASQPPSADFRRQMVLLLAQLERLWSASFSRYVTTRMTDADGVTLGEVDSSFAIALKSLAWLPAMEPDGSGKLRPTTLRGATLFTRHVGSERLLGHQVAYLDAPSTSASALTQLVGVRSTVSVDVVCEQLKLWCVPPATDTADGDEELREMTTSLTHMRAVYRFLQQNLPPKQLQDLFHAHPAIFLPRPADRSDTPAGQFVARTAVRWADPTRLFHKYAASLVLGAAPDGTYRPTLAAVYPELRDVFVGVARVQEEPQVADLCHLLRRVAATTALPAALLDTRQLFTLIGRLVEADEGVAAAVTAVLEGERVIPVDGGRWQGADSHPMIADDRELEALFCKKANVSFVDIERTNRGRDAAATRASQLCTLRVLGVRALTESVRAEPITEMSEACAPLACYVARLLPYLQKLLYSEHRPIHDALVADGVVTLLADMRFLQVSSLQLVYSLKHDADTVVVVPERCRLIDRSQLCVQRDHVSSYNDIIKELARFFSSGDQQCLDSIRSYLMDLVPLITGSDPQLEKLLYRHRELDVLPPDVISWKVTVPEVVSHYRHPQRIVCHEEAEVEEEEKGMEGQDDVASANTNVLPAWPPRSADAPRPRDVRGSAPLSAWPLPPPPSTSELTPARGDGAGSTAARGVQGAAGSGHPPHRAPAHGDGGGVAQLGSHASHGHTSHDDDGDDIDDGVHHGAKSSVGPRDGGQRSADGGVRGGRGRREEGRERGGEGSGEGDGEGDGEGAIEQDDGTPAGGGDVSALTGDVTTTTTADGACLAAPPGEPPEKKRARSDSGDNLLGEEPMKRSTTFGAPVWTADATVCLYEPLSTPCAPPPLPPSDDPALGQAVGRWGEQLVWSFLCGQRDCGAVERVQWQNADEECGLPYDFVVRGAAVEEAADAPCPRDDAGNTYIEVKSTLRGDKDYFEVSPPQLDFARLKRGAFHVYRVVHAGDTHRVRLYKLCNLAEHIETKRVKLFIAI